MNRLTEKDYCRYDIANREDFNDYNNEEDSEMLFQCLQKLGQIEDIEEELDIDLKIIGKLMLTKKCYCKLGKKIFECKVIYYDFEEKSINIHGTYENWEYPALLKLCDYGKTWSIRKEDLL